MKIRINSESGQAIVLLVISLVVLLGFTALALDGGMAYSDRRITQNAADSAALAGGGAAASALEEFNIVYTDWGRCGEVIPAAEQAAIAQALNNSYTIHPWENADDANFVKVECNQVGYAWYIKVTVEISKDTPTSMAHLLFSGPLTNTVDAVTKISPRRPLYYGNSIISLSDEPCSGPDYGVTLQGGVEVYLSGGGVFSHSCLYANGTNDLIVSGGSISYVDRLIDPGRPYLDPEPQQAAPLPPEEIDPPRECSQWTTQPEPSYDSPINPGRYTTINPGGGTNVVLNPGLYCIDGDFYIGNNSSVTGHGVTIYSENGSFTVTGTSSADLSAPLMCPDDANTCPPALEGILVYMENGDVTMLGTGQALYTGTIYAPNGNIEAGGTADASSIYNVQIIGWTVRLHGTTGVGFVFNWEDYYKVPAMLDLFR
jgi:hypothetical protein